MEGEPFLTNLLKEEKIFNTTKEPPHVRHVQFKDDSVVFALPAQKSSALEPNNNHNTNILEHSLIVSSAKKTPASDLAGVGSKVLVNSGCNTDSKFIRECGINTETTLMKATLVEERLKKLIKSETIGFDLIANKVIAPLIYANAQKSLRFEYDEEERSVLVNESDNAKNFESKTPTPLISSSSNESVDSLDGENVATTKTTTTKTTTPHQNNIDELLTYQKKINNLTTATQSQIPSPINSIQYNKSALDHHVAYYFLTQQKHQVTSPLLKSLNERSTTKAKTTSSTAASPSTLPNITDDDDTSAPCLLRSSSFTLDVPSRALLDHLQRQRVVQTAFKSQNGIGITSRSGKNNHKDSKMNSALPVRTHQHQQHHYHHQLKPTAKRLNIYPSTTAYLWNKPLSAAAPVKYKKSPYETKIGKSTTTTSKPNNNNILRQQQQHQCTASTKLDKPTHHQHALKRSFSGTTFVVQQQQQQHQQPTREVVGEIESRHRRRLNLLIAQHRNREQRMQQSFNAQRQLLLDQFNNEMSQINDCVDNSSMQQQQQLHSTSTQQQQQKSSATTLQVEGISIKSDLDTTSNVPGNCKNGVSNLANSSTFEFHAKIVQAPSFDATPPPPQQQQQQLLHQQQHEQSTQHVQEAVRSTSSRTAGENYMSNYSNSCSVNKHNQFPFRKET